MRGREGRRGFTLLEVVVAVTILELGMVGVAGLAFLAARSLARARSAGWSGAMVSEVADSLARHGVGGPGGRTLPGGRIRWSTGASPAPGLVVVVLEAVGPGPAVVLRARAVLPVADTGRASP